MYNKEELLKFKSVNHKDQGCYFHFVAPLVLFTAQLLQGFAIHDDLRSIHAVLGDHDRHDLNG